MIEKKTKYVLSFSKTSEAMHMDKLNSEKKLHGKMIPVPRSISSGCGIAYSIDIKYKDIIDNLIEENNLSVAGKHIIDTL